MHPRLLLTLLAAKLDGFQAAGSAGAFPDLGTRLPLPPGEGMKCLPHPALPESESGLEPVQPAALDALDQFQQGLLTLEDMEALLGQGEML